MKKKSSSGISTSSLFHFTDHRRHLLSILQSGFHPKYSLESFDFLHRLLPQAAFPMVCFCDIPLSQARDHLDMYGKYGIGLTKKWGMRQRISPILYAYSNSTMTQQLNRVFTELEPLTPHHSREYEERMQLVFALFAHLKPYEGSFRHRKKLFRNVRFYDEREWRFVPKSTSRPQMNCMSLNDFRQREVRESYEAILRSKSPLDFNPSDIKYIVVAKESEIPSLIDDIGRLRRHFTDTQRKLLTSRIVSSEQIYEDF